MTETMTKENKTPVPVYMIYVCLFCNKPGMGSEDPQKRGGLINIPVLYKGRPLTINGQRTDKMNKLKVKCHKVCLDKVADSFYQAKMRARQSAAIT